MSTTLAQKEMWTQGDRDVERLVFQARTATGSGHTSRILHFDVYGQGQ